MELVNDKNSFDPTPKLKSSPIPIEFISFNEKDINCVYCGEAYIKALLCWQKYCKKCLSSYINSVTDNNNIYLDVYIYTMDLVCSEHEINRTKVPQSIQECCRNCLKILCFKQIFINYDLNYYTKDNINIYDKVIESEKYCKLCGKLLYQGTNNRIMKQFKLCSDCYLISSEQVESTLVKKKISIFYLPWWHNNYKCNTCYSKLIFTSNCQKYCASCYIFYIGCRYCLTTNIIFGPTLQSQCKKCKRISHIISDFDDFLYNNLICDNLDNLKLAECENIVKRFCKYFTRDIFDYLFKEKNAKPIRWIPYSQFTDVVEMTKGGYGTIYKATWLSENETVILKRFENSENNNINFLNELKSNKHCFNKSFYSRIIKIYGFTKDPKLEDYIIVMKYASEGDLHKYLQKNFTDITWNKQKLLILWQISEGLEYIHNNKFIHRDFHSGNILFDKNNHEKRYQWKIGDLGLSQSIDNKSPNNEIYGVIPYIAPEIFKGSSFSKETDIYSLGMIMWELTTDGERPEITEDTPECYAELMKSCWNSEPKKRPSIKQIRLTFGSWSFRGKNKEEFNQAEEKRMGLIKNKKIGPEFAEKYHPKAVNTSRPLGSLISKCSSINSFLTISFNNKQDYNYNYISLEQELDIDIKSSALKKRRNEVFLNVEPHDNNVKKRTRNNLILY
ncbi:kinase-like domain-containing protein [Rhizophagus clarus]|uniref:Kinase-like domain-containing protein n=1 Tax=Rhizophagus clarus TaxID=94130 RepID=A0A8H3KTP9_9GLOM|nr:kinase-like domain-containing protein [Rhizophagus clarus]